MQLSEQAISEFKALCREEFDAELSDADLEREAVRVLSLFWLVLTDEEPETDQVDSEQ
jgi:hypothetical protein